MRYLGSILAGAIVVASAGCSSLSVPEPAGSCAPEVTFEGVRYLGRRHAMVLPEPGPILGQATEPGCVDTGYNGTMSTPPDSTFDVYAIVGLDPSVAVLVGDETILTQEADVIPDEIATYLTAPACHDGESVGLGGTWLGIRGADGKTELELQPPYDLTMRADESSIDRFLRAELTIRVQEDLGTPIIHEDVERSLRTGGEIQISATCRDGKLVATSVHVP